MAVIFMASMFGSVSLQEVVWLVMEQFDLNTMNAIYWLLPNSSKTKISLGVDNKQKDFIMKNAVKGFSDRNLDLIVETNETGKGKILLITYLRTRFST
ncbi:hypothetical protein ACHAW6_003991 [Cyclotella cf. meneghiniana]